MIPNHIAPALSTLDVETIRNIKPGGNWQDIPESVPSNRIKQIRKSFNEGKGSRSTYYGRLLPDDPSYTISTFFPRPGNGCNIHYSQARTISYREAARLQSFPDNFVFKGSKSAIATQIGNAVPPLLGFQIARSLQAEPGAFVDLFSGAGGLGLGFVWAGWKPIVASDLDTAALETHSSNIDCPVVPGDIADPQIQSEIVERVHEFRLNNPNTKIFVLGGPPCQGFSTANGLRTTADIRNWLFKEYVNLVRAISPTGFVFENVTGILNFEKGKFFDMIQEELLQTVETLRVEKLNAANFGIPQRRSRVIVFGGTQKQIDSVKIQSFTYAPPVSARELRGAKINGLDNSSAIMAKEALNDLPTLQPGEDGTELSYKSLPESQYQMFMRGEISPQEYVSRPRNLSSVFYNELRNPEKFQEVLF